MIEERPAPAENRKRRRRRIRAGSVVQWRTDESETPDRCDGHPIEIFSGWRGIIETEERRPGGKIHDVGRSRITRSFIVTISDHNSSIAAERGQSQTEFIPRAGAWIGNGSDQAPRIHVDDIRDAI